MKMFKSQRKHLASLYSKSKIIEFVPQNKRSPFLAKKREYERDLNLHIIDYEVKPDEVQLNTNYIIEKKKSILREQYNRSLINQTLNVLKQQSLFERLKRSIFRNKKPFDSIIGNEVQRIKSDPDQVDSYKDFLYLTDLENVDLQEKFLNEQFIRFSMEMLQKKHNLFQSPSSFFKLASKILPNEVYFSDKYAYFSEGIFLDIKRFRVINSRQLVGEMKEQEREVVMNHKMVLDYFLGFKDKESYSISRHLKNNILKFANVQEQSLFLKDKYFSLRLNINDREYSLLYHLKRKKFLNFYFPSEYRDLFVIDQEDKELLVFKEGNSLKFVVLEEEYFDARSAEGVEISSIAEYLSKNLSQLIDNTLPLADDAKLFYESAEEEEVKMMKFGNVNLMESFNMKTLIQRLYLTQTSEQILLFEHSGKVDFGFTNQHIYVWFLNNLLQKSIEDIEKEQKVQSIIDFRQLYSLEEEFQFVFMKGLFGLLSIFLINHKAQMGKIMVYNEKTQQFKEFVIEQCSQFQMVNQNSFFSTYLFFYKLNLFGQKELCVIDVISEQFLMKTEPVIFSRRELSLFGFKL